MGAAVSSAMIPDAEWGTKRGNPAGLLCAPCLRMGIMIPPPLVVIVQGESMCVDHALPGAKPV